MSSDGDIAQFTAGEMIAVPLPQIERELAKLWRRVADQRGGQAVTRACLWNLVVRTATDEGYQRSKRIIDAISPDVPARVLVLKGRSDPAASLRAWIETNWHQGDGGKRQIGSDEITLEGGPSSDEDLAAMVRALLLPDVPTAALWPDATPERGSALDRELLHAADRLVVGGESEGGLRALAAVLSQDRRIGAGAIGLSWLRASTWRQLTASLFDPPTPLDELQAIEAVAIECAPERAGSALLFVGWLASRLRWSDGRPTAPLRYRFTGARGRAIDVALTLTDGAPDPFAQVALTNASGDYSIARAAATVIINTPSVAYKQPLHFADDAELWTAALSGQGQDPLFVDALQRVAAL